MLGDSLEGVKKAVAYLEKAEAARSTERSRSPASKKNNVDNDTSESVIDKDAIVDNDAK